MDQPLPSQDAVDLVRVARLVRPFETLEARAVRRPGGGWSIGYGHVSSAREGAEVSRDEAEALLLYDLGHVASVVRSAIYAPIHRNQLEALIALAFHIGTENFLRSTTLHRFNAGDSLGAAQEIERWCRADLDGEAQVVDALVRRRAAEKAHFLTPPQGFPKASRARVRPQFDASAPAPLDEAVEAAPSAALAAAHSVSARLRALVPDEADQAELAPSTFEPEPTPARPLEPAETVVAPPQTDPAPVAPPIAAAAAPVLFETFAPHEQEIPPPPMPFEDLPHPAKPDPASYPDPAGRSDPAGYDIWPSFTPGQVGADDPFAQGPLELASIEAPPLDRSAPISSLFRPKPEHRVQIPPRLEQIGEAPSPRAGGGGVPRSWLWACIVVGLLVFIWAVWSIFTTNPGLVNFVAGLAGIAVMAVPAYLLLGAKRAAN
jgi:lysozyme